MSAEIVDVIEPTDKAEIGKIALTEILFNEISDLCMSEELSDVTFEIQNEMIPGHLLILAARSEYFRAMLLGGLAESKQKVIKLQVPVEAFKAVLMYLYSGHLLLSQMHEDNILDTLCLVHEYGLDQPELGISKYLGQILSLDNVCAIFDTAKIHGLETLQNVCLKFLDTNASGILVHESFKNFSEETLKDMLCRDSFYAPEAEIFNAVSEWCKHNAKISTQSVVSLVRLPLMSFDELFKEVQSSGVFDSDTLLEAIKQKTTSTSLPHRKSSCHEENLVNKKIEVCEPQGECSTLLVAPTVPCQSNHNYNDLVTKKYVRHKITANRELGIIVELNTDTYINHLKILLSSRDRQSCSYFVDVSLNKTQWERVIDYQTYFCRSWQYLYFQSKTVRYIKLAGILYTIKPIFEVFSLEPYHIPLILKLINGIVVPTKNVAAIEMGATVYAVKGLYPPESLLNGDKDFGFAYHIIGNGSITVQLGQPYVIGSIRLLLLDSDDRSYSYYIETSTNEKDWKILVDKRSKEYRSWQHLIFKPRVMVFIRIIGTKSSANNEFHCLYFECPSQLLRISYERQQAGRAKARKR